MNREILRKQSGFSLIELIITMTVFVMAIAVASSIFVPMLTQFKQQSKVSETQVERLVGLDILRKDIEQAGYGLPWVIPDVVVYNEAGVDGATGWVERDYNDGPNRDGGATQPTRGTGADTQTPGGSFPPGAVRNGNAVAGTLHSSDVLVIKATNIAINDAAPKWTYVEGAAGGTYIVNMWASSEDLNNGDRVIVLIPMRGQANQRILVSNAGVFSLQFNDTVLPSAFAPSTERDVFLIYGVDPDTDLGMPFNRADYYVERPGGAGEMPPRCAGNTGILYKGIVRQSDGYKDQIRLIECVADMQLGFGWDMDEDGDFELQGLYPGSTDEYKENINIYTAEEIRDHLKEVRVYILAHEGQRDSGYDFNGFSTDGGACATCVEVGDVDDLSVGRYFDLQAAIPDFEEYRWKVYTVVVKPANLSES